MRNTNPDLPWSTTVSHLNHFSDRMRLSGYKQEYRYQVLKSGVEGYEKNFDIEKSGGRPVKRPRTWEQDRSQRKKELEKCNWFRKGGYQIPLFAPHTPGGELVKRMKKKEAENNQGRRVRFKIVGKGGLSLVDMLRKSNPWKGDKCGRPLCFPCKGSRGGDCWR